MGESTTDDKPLLEEIVSEEASRALREAPLPEGAELMVPVPMGREDPGSDWILEPLLHGVRCLALWDAGSLRLLADGERPLSAGIPKVERALRDAGPTCFALDGILLDVDPEFEQAMVLPGADRSRQPGGRELEPCFLAFDLLHVAGYDLTGLPLVERRRVLRTLFHFSPTLLYARESVAPARIVFEQAEREGWRGVVAKRRDGRYDPGAEEWRVWRRRDEPAVDTPERDADG